MCEASAYILRGDQEELILKSVDVLEPRDDGGFLLVDIIFEESL